MKKCYTCKKEKVLTDFVKAPHTADGRVSQCKECRREWARKNSEKVKSNYHGRFDMWIG